MIYIHKTKPSDLLLHFIEQEKKRSNNHPTYTSLQSDPAYKELRKQLCIEQRNLCCYCMQIISPENSILEHFLPESIFAEEQTNYYNLYLACKSSCGKTPKQQHCDVVKGNYLIAKFIGYKHDGTNKKCQDFFKYNEITGEILPFGNYKTINDYHKNYSDLTTLQKEVLSSIETLNLNTISLVADRLRFINTVFQEIEPLLNDKEKLEALLNEYESGNSMKFAGVAIYFIKLRLSRL